MSRLIACSRRLLADRRGTAPIGYSSIMLLVAITAIAMPTQFRRGANLGGANLGGANLGGANLPPDSRIDFSH